MLSNCGAGEDSWELPWTARRSNQSILKEIKFDIYWKDWCWSSNTLTTWSKESTHWKDPDAGKDWGQEEKGTTEDKMVGWHHWLDGHEFKQAPGVVMHREAWCAAVQGFTKSWTWLSNWIKMTYRTSQLSLLLFSCWVMSDSFVTPWTMAGQTSLSMGFPRQEYWNGLPFPSLGESSQPRNQNHVSCIGR